jgi:hypothetical protein
MSHVPELQLLAHMLARARMSQPSGLRPARRIAMAARHRYDRQLSNR